MFTFNLQSSGYSSCSRWFGFKISSIIIHRSRWYHGLIWCWWRRSSESLSMCVISKAGANTFQHVTRTAQTDTSEVKRRPTRCNTISGSYWGLTDAAHTKHLTNHSVWPWPCHSSLCTVFSLTHHDKLVTSLFLLLSLFCYGCPSLLSLILSHESYTSVLFYVPCYPSSPTHRFCRSPPKPTPEESCLSSRARGGLVGRSKMCSWISPTTATSSSSSLLEPLKSSVLFKRPECLPQIKRSVICVLKKVLLITSNFNN